MVSVSILSIVEYIGNISAIIRYFKMICIYTEYFMLHSLFFLHLYYLHHLTRQSIKTLFI